MVEMISATLADEMARDERIVVLGEDVADCCNEEDLEHVKGKGGGFQSQLLACSGASDTGASLTRRLPRPALLALRWAWFTARGLKPPAEIQFSSTTSGRR